MTGAQPTIRDWVRSVAPRRQDVRADALAGLPGAIGSVPDGMAAGVLAGVAPVHGLYACIAGPIAGGLLQGSALMVVTTTSAAALAAGSGVSGLDPDDRAGAVVLLTLIAGAFMLLAGALRVGRATRFVSHSVMLGFLSGVAVNILCGQLPDLTGVEADGATNVAKAVNVLLHPADWDAATLLVGLGAVVLIVLGSRTSLPVLGPLLGLAVPTAAVALFGLDTVARVEDSGNIPAGLPAPALPDLGALSGPLVAASAAVAAIVLVQGAGVAESVPQPHGRVDANRDFLAEGAGNVASALLQGMPVGGSVGQSTINVASGARSRWAAIWSGIWMAVILVALAGVVGVVAMPTLASILVVASVGALRPHEVVTVLRAGPNSAVAVVSTFVATLTVPVAAAVGMGVVVSLLLQLNQEAVDLKVVRLVHDEQGALREVRAPRALASGDVVVLEVYGSLFYAGSRTLQAHLPEPGSSRGAVVILRLRGRTTLGATFFSVVSAYSELLRAADGRLMLTGVDPALAARLRDDDRLTGAALLYEATPVIGASTRAAIGDASAWVVEARQAPAGRDPDR